MALVEADNPTWLKSFSFLCVMLFTGTTFVSLLMKKMFAYISVGPTPNGVDQHSKL